LLGDDCSSGGSFVWVVRHCGRRAVCGRRKVEEELWKGLEGAKEFGKVEDELWKILEGAEKFGKRKGNFIFNVFLLFFSFFNFDYKFVPE